MARQPVKIIKDGTFRLEEIAHLNQKPHLFEPGEPHFWDDPHISHQMLAAHLDPTTYAASYPPEVIDSVVGWIIDTVGLAPGDAVLDLGCGPGLYCKQFAAQGLKTKGIDLSQNSIEYARRHDEDTEYLCQNYLTLDEDDAFNGITLISYDFCVLSAENAARLLRNVHRALVRGGSFVFDVMTPHNLAGEHLRSEWGVHPEGGFWKPGPYLVLKGAYV